MTVFLLSVGRDRFELYSEPAEDVAVPQNPSRWRAWAHRAGAQWRDLVDLARSGASTGRIARWRDRIVCRLAETIAEQRTLWALTPHTRATALFPSTLTAARAQAALDRALGTARRRHGFWIAIDGPLFVASAILAPLPGPNAVAYYMAFRVVGHCLSWRGARHAMKRITWTFEPDASLAELAALADLPRAARAARVDAIAERLNLSRLSAFFERVAV